MVPAKSLICDYQQRSLASELSAQFKPSINSFTCNVIVHTKTNYTVMINPRYIQYTGRQNKAKVCNILHYFLGLEIKINLLRATNDMLKFKSDHSWG